MLAGVDREQREAHREAGVDVGRRLQVVGVGAGAVRPALGEHRPTSRRPSPRAACGRCGSSRGSTAAGRSGRSRRTRPPRAPRARGRGSRGRGDRPRPAEVRVPSGRGRSHSRWRRRATAFFGEVGPTSTAPVAEPAVSPSKSSRIREPGGAATASRGPPLVRASAHSAPAPSTREAATRSRFSPSSRALTPCLPWSRRSRRSPKLRCSVALPSRGGQTGVVKSSIRSLKVQKGTGWSVLQSLPGGHGRLAAILQWDIAAVRGRLTTPRTRQYKTASAMLLR